MAESSLSYTLDALRLSVMRFIGKTGLYSSLSAKDQEFVTDVIDSGIRQFYWPPIVPGQTKAHRWSFMRLELNVSTTADEWEITLDDDFGGLSCGTLTFDPDQSQYSEIKVVTPDFIDKKRMAENASTSAPQWCAVRWDTAPNATEGQRASLIIYPTADAEYDLNGWYEPAVDKLSATSIYPYGGAQYTETVIESCLAIAEQRINDEVGLHTKKFYERLMAGISQDQQTQPRHYGVMNDGRRRPSRPHNYVTYNGTLY